MRNWPIANEGTVCPRGMIVDSNAMDNRVSQSDSQPAGQDWLEEIALRIGRIGALCWIAVALSPRAWVPAAVAQSIAAASAAAVPDDFAWRQNLLAWRAQRERELAAPDGWLTLVGLEWLKPGVNSVGTAADCQVKLHAQAPAHIGMFTVSGKLVQLLSPAGGFPAGLTVDGAPAREGPLKVDDQKPSTIAWHGLSMTVLERGGRYTLRIKDADSPTRTGHQSLHWYEPDPRYRVTAQWIPFEQPLIERIPTAIGTTLDIPSPGLATFTFEGKPYRLQPIVEAGQKDKLFFILRDETSESTTYAVGRFLHTGLPDQGLSQPGQLVLDFNQLYNPPCAYTTYASCPLPPEQNRLPIALPAGEQKYMH
jgi:uncharacterized protein (DUF1684 family)